MARNTYLKKVLGEDRLERLANTKVIMIGAGGIGCELLKDLLLSGYGEIHIVDLDTVTLSNLNRQFLFRKKDIDKSKSLTIAKAVQSFNYFNAKLVPHHGNIMDTTQFPLSWWDQFSFIYNALDNLEARRYVNKMALFLKKPLMESGTTGFEGQIQPIYPYYSECFDCQAKVTPKTYPVCTIRSTPSLPVHCITWAKEFLFHQLFDESESDLSNSETIQNETDDAQEIENLAQEANELIELRKSIKTTDASPFIEQLVLKIFKGDIERLLLIDTLWKSRKKPTPLDWSTYKAPVTGMLSDISNQSLLINDTKVWTVLENIYVLYKSGSILQRRIKSGKESFISFDKDDEDTLNFVAAAANLRSSIFNIPIMSKFDIKQIAGNIIPAIATTNAIISGFSSLNGTRYFKYNYDQTGSVDFTPISKESSTVFISIKPNKYITAAALVSPNEKCPSSSLLSRGVFQITEEQRQTLTLGELVEKLVKKYGYEEGDLSVIVGKSRLVYDIDFDDNVEKKLSEIGGIGDGELILVQDENDRLENLELYVKVTDEEREHVLPELKLRPKKSVGDDQSVETEEESGGDVEQVDGVVNENDAIVIIDEEDDGLVELDEPALKKRRIQVQSLA
ncbi:uncharacterized protein RJT20DRAFT_127843 [Scheffersomyces xylosifermentans]|uniref:uncharacterized protein n=1 Tax=Scheffersomyces xylosifermentans TaxID=1304137 RepID=UPI00315CCE9A